MSTITRIKGEINNPNFPVLTADGLKSYYYGKYVNALAELGFTLSETQDAAIETFLNTLMDNEVMQFVKCMYPLIGTTSVPLAANVPLIGDKSFGLPSDFDGFVYDGNAIRGYNKLPAVATLKVKDFADGNNAVGMAVTLNKASTTNVSSFIDRLLSFDDASFQVRLQKQSGTKPRFNFFYMTHSWGKTTQYANTRALDTDVAGTLIGAWMFAGDPYYSRWVKIGTTVDRAKGTDLPNWPALSNTDMEQPMIATAPAYTCVNYVSTITAFQGRPSVAQLAAYMEALETLITALGKG